MKTLVLFVVLAMTFSMLSEVAKADVGTDELIGTWSGGWTPAGGVYESITVELKKDDRGTLTGKFLTPSPMNFVKASLNPKTGIVLLEAFDEKSGKQYRLNAKVQGTELNGTLTANAVTGKLQLIKWTFSPRFGSY